MTMLEFFLWAAGALLMRTLVMREGDTLFDAINFDNAGQRVFIVTTLYALWPIWVVVLTFRTKKGKSK